MTVSFVGTPAVIADENGEVHYSTSSSTYVPTDERAKPSEEMVRAGTPMMVSGARVYFINDDPAYDLSGAGDHWFLLGDGTAFHEQSWRSPAALASAGAVAHEVVPISAEYRQDWLAVCAGDRPVRTFTAPRYVTDTGAMASNAEMTRTMPDNDRDEVRSARSADTFRPVHHPRHHRTHYTAATRYRTYHRRHHAAMTSTRRATYHAAQTTMAEPAVTTESNVEVRRDEMGHQLFQMGSSWYMMDNGDWFRSESWRGPFVHVRKGMVPREVRMSEKHPSRMDMD
ncbi:MAG TPA: hypothetical protein VEU09_00820 [Candidatus Binatia bacterium]|nr:hypothetical protein [Candidatus Binatia bacterium]